MGLPVRLHVQHTGELKEQRECVVKTVFKFDLQRPHIDVGLVLQLLLVQVLKTIGGGKAGGREGWGGEGRGKVWWESMEGRRERGEGGREGN